MKQKRKRLNITSSELQLIKNYYNFRKTNLIKTDNSLFVPKEKKSIFICYGTINVISGYQREKLNTFINSEKNKVDFHFERLSASSIKILFRFSHLKNIEQIMNSGIYKLIIKINIDNTNNNNWSHFDNYAYMIKLLNQLKALNPTDENTFCFLPSIIIDVSGNNTHIPIRPDQLKKCVNQKINIQIRSYLIYFTNKLKLMAE